jgi:hypothetical protein
LDLTKREWGELKWLLECYANAKEPAAHKGEWMPFYRFFGKLAIAAVRDLN